MHVHLTPKSRNEKTGPIPVSTTTASTCPPSCPFNNANEGGCYAEAGPLALHWRKVTSGERGGSWSAFCDQIEALPAGTFWRHNQAGDLPGDGVTIDADKLGQLVEANAGKAGFTYTHYPLGTGNLAAITMANRAGFTVNLSANDPGHADELAATGLPVVTVLPTGDHGKKSVTTPEGRRIVVCPATYRDDVSCATCKLCASNKADRPIVGFPAHGTSKRKADAIAARLTIRTR